MKELFGKYQPQLIKLANHSLGRKYLGISHECKDKIVGLAPNAYVIQVDKSKAKATFRTYPLFEKKLGLALKFSDSLLEGIKYYFTPQQMAWVEMNVSPETINTVSGDGNNASGPGVWTTMRERADADHVNKVSPVRYFSAFYNGGSPYLVRGFTPFNLDIISDGNTCTDCVASLCSQNVSNEPGEIAATLSESTQASGTDLVLADYSKITLNNPIEFATRQELSTWTGADGTYYDFNLNTAGKSACTASFGNFFKLVWRSDRDVDDVVPTLDSYVQVYQSYEAGTTKDPKLVVTYSLSGGSFLGLI